MNKTATLLLLCTALFAQQKLMYELYQKDSIYNPAENFLRKYWGIYEENACR